MRHRIVLQPLAHPCAVLGASLRVPLDCCHAVREAAALCRPVPPCAALCAGELFVFGYGCFLQHLTRKLGVVTSILTHAGGDAVVAFVLADCIWNFLPPLR